MVKSLSGVLTVRFKNEKERNITIKLGYANAKVKIGYIVFCIIEFGFMLFFKDLRM